MIAQELSRYPATYDEDQRRLDSLVFRDSAARDLGSLAVMATTGGILDAKSPDYQQQTPEAVENKMSITRNLGAAGLSTLLVREQADIRAALDYSLASQHASSAS